jgi:polysaccharide biosynthesis PFTS motif protein
MLQGKWEHAFLFRQSIIAKKFSFIKQNQLAKKYLFSNSSWLQRPLWTYEVENLGADVILYFYSTNNEPINDSFGRSVVGLGYSTMNWPNYFVWDKYQYDFIKNTAFSYSNIHIVGCIKFISGPRIFIPKSYSITVFDVSPYNNFTYAVSGLHGDYYKSENVIKFLDDIYVISIKLGIKVRLKLKRALASKIDKRYKNYLIKMKKNNGFEFVDPDISPDFLISTSLLSISYPFTSTSVIAKELNFPTAYYDVTGQIVKEGCSSHGIILLSNKYDLENWIINNLR